MNIQSLDSFIKIFVAILPFFLFKDYRPTFSQGLFFMVGTFFLYGLSIGLPAVRAFKDKWLKFIFLWLLICVFFKDNPLQNQEWFNFWLSFSGFIYVLAGLLLFNVVYSYTEDIKGIFHIILIVCALNFSMVIMQLLEHNILWLNPVGITGCFSTVNQLSQYSAMALPIAYFLHPLLAVIPLFTLIVSGSFIEQTPSGYMAVFAGFIFLAIMRKIKKRDMVIFVLVFIVGLLLTYKHTIAQLIPWFTISRPVSWKTAISYILKKPWLGYGYQSYTEVVKTKVMSLGYYDASANPGSDWLHNIFEFGLPISIFVIAFFKGLWGKFYNNEQERITYFLVASVIIGLSNMLWQNMIRCAAPGGTFIVLLALLCIKLNEVYPGEVKTKEG